MIVNFSVCLYEVYRDTAFHECGVYGKGKRYFGVCTEGILAMSYLFVMGAEQVVLSFFVHLDFLLQKTWVHGQRIGGGTPLVSK